PLAQSAQLQPLAGALHRRVHRTPQSDPTWAGVDVLMSAKTARRAGAGLARRVREQLAHQFHRAEDQRADRRTADGRDVQSEDVRAQVCDIDHVERGDGVRVDDEDAARLRVHRPADGGDVRDRANVLIRGSHRDDRGLRADQLRVLPGGEDARGQVGFRPADVRAVQVGGAQPRVDVRAVVDAGEDDLAAQAQATGEALRELVDQLLPRTAEAHVLRAGSDQVSDRDAGGFAVAFAEAGAGAGGAAVLPVGFLDRGGQRGRAEGARDRARDAFG